MANSQNENQNIHTNIAKIEELETENEHLKQMNDVLRNLVTEYTTKHKEIECQLTHEFIQKEDQYTSHIEQLQHQLASHKKELSHQHVESLSIKHVDKLQSKYNQILEDKHQLQQQYDSLQNKFNGQIKLIQDQFESKYHQLQMELFALTEIINQQNAMINDLKSELELEQQTKSIIKKPSSSKIALQLLPSETRSVKAESTTAMLSPDNRQAQFFTYNQATNAVTPVSLYNQGIDSIIHISTTYQNNCKNQSIYHIDVHFIIRFYAN